MLVYLVASLLVCLSELTGAQYYGSQSRPPQYSPQQQNSQAWRQWYYQRRQQQQQRENSSRGRPSTPIASPAANYYPSRYQQQQYSGNSQQYYQQGQYPQQQYSGYRQPGYGDYRQPNYQPPPPPMTPPPPVTPAVPVEVEFEMEVPTTTTTLRPQNMYNSWGQYNQGYGSNGYYGNQYNQDPAYQGAQYHPQQQQQPQSSGYGSYYQQPTAAQQPSPQQQPQPQQPQAQQQQPPAGQSSFNQPAPSPQQQPQQGVFGLELPQPAEMTNPNQQFPGKFDMSALKPTVFNPNYQGSSSTGTGTGEAVGQTGQNPNAPPGKVDFGSKGPNPIQLNQFLAQPNAPKDSNALDALLGTLLTGTVAAQGNSKPLPSTTKAPPPSPQSGLISDRLDGFVLGPKSEFRSNMFSEIPVNNEAYDSLNPLAGFMGETPPPPVTTTPLPPGRNGDFLEGFIGVSSGGSQPAKTAAAENGGPNIYFYNYMNDNAGATTPAPAHPLSEQALNSMPTQDLSSVVQKLLGVLATKQGQAPTPASQG